MTPEDVLTGGDNLDSLAGGSAVAKINAGEDVTRAALKTNYTTTDERSDKHELMLNNFSGDDKDAEHLRHEKPHDSHKQTKKSGRQLQPLMNGVYRTLVMTHVCSKWP